MAQELVQRKSGILAFGAKALATVLLLATFCVVVVVVVDIFDAEAKAVVGIKRVELLVSKENSTAFNINRKLLRYSAAAADGNRIGTACSKDDIVIYQGSTAPLPNGIPAYTVQILNTCTCVSESESESESGGCSICNIHVNCGWFSSARLVNPQVFRRIHYDDCLVNDGEALPPGQALSFQYANTFQYPLSVSSVVCCSA